MDYDWSCSCGDLTQHSTNLGPSKYVGRHFRTLWKRLINVIWGSDTAKCSVGSGKAWNTTRLLTILEPQNPWIREIHVAQERRAYWPGWHNPTDPFANLETRNPWKDFLYVWFGSVNQRISNWSPLVVKRLTKYVDHKTFYSSVAWNDGFSRSNVLKRYVEE